MKFRLERRLANFLQQQRSNDDKNVDTDSYNAENDNAKDDKRLQKLITTSTT